MVKFSIAIHPLKVSIIRALFGANAAAAEQRKLRGLMVRAGRAYD